MKYSKEFLDKIQYKDITSIDKNKCGYCGMDLKDPKHNPKQCEKEMYECQAEFQKPQTGND